MTGEITYLSSMAKVFKGGKVEGGFELFGLDINQNSKSRTRDRRWKS